MLIFLSDTSVKIYATLIIVDFVANALNLQHETKRKIFNICCISQMRIYHGFIDMRELFKSIQ